MQTKLPTWNYLYGSPSGTGTIRQFPEDFKVTEHLSFEPSGTGEHVFLEITKTGENTEYVARQLAKFAKVRQRDIGFAGMKDRHAITSQWFSVWLPGKSDPNWSDFESSSIKIESYTRHARKLKRGVLSGNSFVLQIRNWQGDSVKVDQQLQAIKTLGLANYYGNQRFGRNGHNIEQALALFAGKKVPKEQRGIYLSAARSFLFNHILSERIGAGLWDKPIVGDTYMFDLGHSSFKTQQPDVETIRRLKLGEIHATAVLWGKGEPGSSAEALALEQAVIELHPELAAGLCASGVDSDRRAIRINVANLHWQFISDSQLELRFTLPAGSYATSLLREIVDFESI